MSQGIGQASPGGNESPRSVMGDSSVKAYADHLKVSNEQIFNLFR